MNVRLLAVLAILAAGCAAPPSPPVMPRSSSVPPVPPVSTLSPLGRAVDAMFEAAARAERFSGAVLVAEHGQIVLARGYGYADADARKPNGPETIFRIGSLTKQFTAAAILVLEQQGKLRVTDRAAKYLPTYPADHLTVNGREVTIHDLLTHTAGIPAYEATAHFREHAWRAVITPDEVIAAVSDKPLDHEPGTKHTYSNTGYVLLGRILENVSGVSYREVLRHTLFEPAGMKDSGVALSRSDEARAALGHSKGLLGHTVLSQSASFGDPELTIAYSAGSIYSTVKDLFLWDRALAGEAVVTAASKEKLFHPALQHYAYGWVVKDEQGIVSQWHNGALSPLGFTSGMLRLPKSGTLVVHLANLDFGLVEPGLDERIESLATGKPLPAKVVVGSEILKRYVGTYRLTPKISLVVTEVDGALFAQATGEGKNPLVPTSESEFRIPGAPLRFIFEVDETNAARGLRLETGSKTIEAKKE